MGTDQRAGQGWGRWTECWGGLGAGWGKWGGSWARESDALRSWFGVKEGKDMEWGLQHPETGQLWFLIVGERAGGRDPIMVLGRGVSEAEASGHGGCPGPRLWCGWASGRERLGLCFVGCCLPCRTESQGYRRHSASVSCHPGPSQQAGCPALYKHGAAYGIVNPQAFP